MSYMSTTAPTGKIARLAYTPADIRRRTVAVRIVTWANGKVTKVEPVIVGGPVTLAKAKAVAAEWNATFAHQGNLAEI